MSMVAWVEHLAGRSKGQIHVILRFEADGSAPATQAQLPPPLTPEQIKAQVGCQHQTKPPNEVFVN